ncbi:MAG TPA: autotransporter-associated beta strand repeat-containing protein, partial [Thermoanaerobaculia bacterium]|nr:autotransporter-associated beta strand repeat-containing protein [Thermoanaerobaculia bacterium]
MNVRPTLATVSLALVLASPLSATVRTWTGTTSATWSTPSNWVDPAMMPGVPVAGDDLVFPAGAPILTTTNDLSLGIVFKSLAFQVAGYTIQGNAFSLSGGIVSAGGGVGSTVQPVVSLAASQMFSTVAGSSLTLSGGVATSTSILTLDVNGVITISGPITGNGDLVKIGTGNLVLSANGSFTGTTAVNQGILTVSSSGALGTAAGGTSVTAGAALHVLGGINVGDPLTLQGTGIANDGVLHNVGGSNTWSGTIQLANATSDTAIGVDPAQTLTITGVVSAPGPGMLRKIGAGTLVLNAANTYLGVTSVESGVVNIRSNAALGNPASGTVVASGAALELQGPLTTLEPLTASGTGIGGTGALRNVSSLNSILGSVTLAASTMIDTAPASTLSLFGVVDGPGDLVKTGTGTLMANAANTYTGATSVTAGVFRLQNGSALGATSTGTTVANGAALELVSVNVGAEPLTIAGSGPTTFGAIRDTGNCSWAGPITLTGTTTVDDGSAELHLSGAISGPFALTKGGGGTLRLSGSSTYSGG